MSMSFQMGGTVHFTLGSKCMAQAQKRGLEKGLYKLCHRDLTMYFYPAVIKEKRRLHVVDSLLFHFS